MARSRLLEGFSDLVYQVHDRPRHAKYINGDLHGTDPKDYLLGMAIPSPFPMHVEFSRRRRILIGIRPSLPE